jgi:hypothetical protein
MGVAKLVTIAAAPHLTSGTIRRIREAPPPTQPSILKPWPERDRRLPDRRSLQRGAEEAVIPGTGQGSGRLDPYSRQGDNQRRLGDQSAGAEDQPRGFCRQREHHCCASDLRDLGYGPSGCYLREGGGRVAGTQRVARARSSQFISGLYNASNLYMAAI